MSAVNAIKVARAAGVNLGTDGDDLVLEAAVRPSTEILDLLSRHKTEVVALLRPGRDGWSAEDWLAFFDERAGVAEFDDGLPRPEDEARAFECCVVEWLNRHPAPSAPGRCAWCGKTESFEAVVLPFGTESGTHTWLHSRCWPAWYVARKADAIDALAAVGIDQPRTHR